MMTICFVYFRSLAMAHLRASLFSLRQQDFTQVEKIIILDNNTDDSTTDIYSAAHEYEFPVPIVFYSAKHKDTTKTHAWSTNAVVRQAFTPWVFFTRADYLLSFDIVKRFASIAGGYPNDWNGFVTSDGSYVGALQECERTTWRENGPGVIQGTTYNHTVIDAGVWLGRSQSFTQVGGLDEHLTAWGHAQTHFQWKLYKTGTEFIRIPEVLFYHLDHGGDKDIVLANQQLASRGVSLQDMWSRYDGPKVY